MRWRSGCVIYIQFLLHYGFTEHLFAGHLRTLFQRADSDQIDRLLQRRFKVAIQRPQREETAQVRSTGIDQQVDIAVLTGFTSA